MANATININAVDNTRSAFLAVQRNLQGVGKQLQVSQAGVAALATRFIGLGAVAGATTRMIREVITATESIKGLDPQVAGSVALLRKDFEDLFGSLDGVVNRTGARFLGFLGNVGRDIGRYIVNPFDAGARAVDRNNDALLGLKLSLARITASPEVTKATEVADAARKSTMKTMGELQAMGVEFGSSRMLSSPALTRTENIDALRVLDRQLQIVNTRIEELRNNPISSELDGPARQAELIAELDKQKKTYEQIGLVGSNLIIQEKERGRLAREAGRILADGFEEAVFSGEKLSKVIAQLGQDILRLVFRNTITTPLANILSAGIPKLFGFADGGLPPTGRPSIVGERGPELFIPGTSGRIVPNHDLGGGGGGGQTYYIDARGADQTGLARLESMIRETRASIRPVALASIIDARARGGSFGRAA